MPASTRAAVKPAPAPTPAKTKPVDPTRYQLTKAERSVRNGTIAGLGVSLISCGLAFVGGLTFLAIGAPLAIISGVALVINLVSVGKHRANYEGKGIKVHSDKLNKPKVIELLARAGLGRGVIIKYVPRGGYLYPGEWVLSSPSDEDRVRETLILFLLISSGYERTRDKILMEIKENNGVPTVVFNLNTYRLNQYGCAAYQKTEGLLSLRGILE